MKKDIPITKYFVNQFIEKNPINFLPYTMAPSEPNTKELEPLDTAISYYESKDCHNLVMQEKFMGSNACLYIFKDKGKCFISTKSGYTKRIPALTDEWHIKVFSKFPNANLVILHGEILPWSFFAKDLIKNVYSNFYQRSINALNMEPDFLYDNILLKRDQGYAEGLELNNTTIRKELINKGSNHRYISNMYNTISLSQFILPKPQRKELLDRFKIQLDYYSNESDLEFKCFNVLKIEYEDRQEVFPFNNYDGWYLFNKSGCIKVDNTINRKHNNWLNEKPRMEGVVIKPFESNLTEVIPALKVRNKEFLRLIYGPYYDSFLSFYINSKKCKGKRKASIKQWQLGFDMLSIPYNNILKNDFQKLVKLFMTCDRKYRNLDFRL